MNMAHWWFTAGRTGNIALAGDTFGETVTLKPGVKNGRAAFRRFRGAAGGAFSVNDKSVTGLVRPAAHTGSYAGIKAEGKRAAAHDVGVWRAEDGDAAEISAIQPRFVRLKQIGSLPEDVFAARARFAGRGHSGRRGSAARADAAPWSRPDQGLVRMSS